jgi:ankyrin repeat protein
MRLTAADVLKRYEQEGLPEFEGVRLNDVNQVGRFGDTPLHVAAVRGNPDEVTALLDGGGDIHATGELGDTALHLAVGQGHRETVELLLSRGASREPRNDDGMTAYAVAVLSGRQPLIDLLRTERGPQ